MVLVSSVESVNSLQQFLSLLLGDSSQRVDNLGQSVDVFLHGSGGDSGSSGFLGIMVSLVSHVDVENSSVSLLGSLLSCGDGDGVIIGDSVLRSVVSVGDRAWVLSPLFSGLSSLDQICMVLLNYLPDDAAWYFHYLFLNPSQISTSKATKNTNKIVYSSPSLAFKGEVDTFPCT